jgi:hypothetical protein
MNQHRPVPRLDLAPKLKRPLSLWNPLDYLRLLYWVFFFPQALRWYVDTFGGGYIPEEEMNWRKGWELLTQNSIQRQFLLQALLLTVVTSLALSLIFQGLDFTLTRFNVTFSVAFDPPNWFDVAFIIAFSVAFGVPLGADWSVAMGVVMGVAMTLIFGLRLSVMWNHVVGFVIAILVFGVVFGVVFGTLMSVLLSVAINVGSRKVALVVADVMRDVANVVNSSKPLIAIISLTLLWLITKVLAGNVAEIGLSLAVAVSINVVAILRLENWLLGLPIALQSCHSGVWQFPHLTPLPTPCLSSKLTIWLRRDWETGLHNANQLLAYTHQFIPVMQAVNRVLAETPSAQVLPRVAQLAEVPQARLLYSASASVSGTINWLRNTETRLDTPTRAAAAGFWYLYLREPEKAAQAFAVVRFLPHGEEMFTLAQTLTTFQGIKDPAAIATLRVPTPKQKPLRPATWKTLATLQRVIEDIQVIQRSVSRSARAFALNRAMGEVGELIDFLEKADTLPVAERGLILDIALPWAKSLLKVAREVGEVSITKPVTNPYVVGDPVEGNLFVGREDVLRQLEELWVMGYQLQSVVLYGHRRMGKTSILRNIANCSGSGVKVAYINLLNMGATSQGVGEVLMAISDAISDAVGCTPPSDADLLNLPYRTFERYLKQVEAQLNGGLIVALDEFEKIEELIEAEKIPKDFMGYLRGLVQMSSKVAFAFAGLHTLEEMTADYFQPFFASVISIHVGFLQPGATRQILANPDEEFPLDYTPEALDQIYALTAGQPYLVQLVGFQLVRRYNDFVFEQGRPREPVFTVEDVEAVINDPEFFKRGRYYFDGVWGQAARGASGQQAILRALAPHPQGLSIDALAQATAMEEKTLQEALKTLTRHDVVQQREGHWQIIVELFRRWVLQN